MKKLLLAVGIAGVLSVAVAGCTSHMVDDRASTGKPSSSSSAVASPAPTKNAAPVVYGSVIPFKKVTDAGGTYEQTTIDPGNVSTKWDASKADSSATSLFSDAELKSAQAYIVKFVAEEGNDSIAVDSNDGWATWQKTTADKYLLPSYKTQLLGKPTTTTSGTLDRSTIIFNNPNSTVPALVRDGGPRIEENVIAANKLTGGTDASAGDYIRLAGTSVIKYRVAEDVARTWVKKNNNAATTDAELRAYAPGLYDGKEDYYHVNVNWSYVVVKYEGGWRIGGYQNVFSSPGFTDALANAK